MKKYDYLIFDADHTLIDFEADEREAFRKIFALCGRRADEDMLARCRELSVRTWDDVGLSDVDDAVIQRTYHELYRSHLPLLFSRIFREFPTEMSPERAAEIFLRLLEEGGATVAEVASQVGFSNPAYFSKVFRARMGRSPREYQKQGAAVGPEGGDAL